MHSLALNHGFIDGNKRTALYMMDLLLRRSGYRLRQRRAATYNDDVEAMVTAVVEHRLDFEGAGRLVQRTDCSAAETLTPDIFSPNRAA